ncbi:MAG: hypothetical protein AB1813_18945 [Verrucomicrobiota bacterium]
MNPFLHSLQRVWRLAMVGAWLSGWAGICYAADAPKKPDFQMLTETIEIPERGSVPSYAILSSSLKFSFLPPPNWKMESNPLEKSITLTTPDFSTVLRFQITTNQERKLPIWRQRIQEQLPEAKIVREFVCYTSGRQGMAFDCEQTLTNKFQAATRIAYIPFEDGTVEFQMTSSPDKLRQHHFAFGCLLNSFRIDPWPAKKISAQNQP